MTTKKILSLLICLVMVLSLMPMSAFATEGGEGIVEPTQEIVPDFIIEISSSGGTYTGTSMEPGIAIKTTDGTPVQSGTDYKVSYTHTRGTGRDFTNAGTLTVTVTGQGKYEGKEVTKNFVISPAPLSVTVDSPTKVYGEDDPELTGTVTGAVNGETIKFNYSRVEGEAVNTYAIKATLDSSSAEIAKNYSINSVEGTLTILPKPVTVQTSLYPTIYDYTGTAITPNVSVTCAEASLAKDVDYTVTYANNEGVGKATYTVSPKEGSNYTFTPVTGEFDITSSALTVTLAGDSFTYSGEEQTPEVTVKYGGTTLTKDTEYKVTYGNNTNAGTATVTVTGAGNFAGKSGTATFTITPKKIVPDVTLAANYYPYTGAAIEPAVTVTYSESGPAVDLQYTVEYSDNVNVGTSAKVVVKDKTGDNYSFDDVTKTFEIIEATSNNLSVTVNGGPFTYNGKAQEPSVTVKDGTTELTKDVHYTVAYSNNTAAGTATVFVSGKEGTDYAGRLGSATFPIAPKTVAPTLKLDRTSYGYTGQQIKPAVTVYDGSTVIPSDEYTVTYGTNVSGTGTVTVTDNTGGNYAFNPAAVAINFSIVSNIQYRVVIGSGGCWYRGSYYGLGFRCDGPYSDFIGITIDGQPVDKSYYVASEGSTNVGLYPQLLSMLGNGTHYITFKYTSGSATGVFYVGSTAINAVMTGDDNNAGLMALVMGLGILSSVTILSVLRKRKTNA